MSGRSLNPYLIFNGNCAAAFHFYTQCLGADIESMKLFTASPMEECVPAGWSKKVMHASLNWNGFRLMGSDGCRGETHDDYKGFALSIGVEDPTEAERLFIALAEGGQIKMHLEATPWARCFGMLIDQFGVDWMVSCE